MREREIIITMSSEWGKILLSLICMTICFIQFRPLSLARDFFNCWEITLYKDFNSLFYPTITAYQRWCEYEDLHTWISCLRIEDFMFAVQVICASLFYYSMRKSVLQFFPSSSMDGHYWKNILIVIILIWWWKKI